MTNPAKYWRTNVNGSLNLIEATLAAGVRHFVFSSTCATYGDQDGVTLDEDTPQMPINAYGGSKRAIEMMLRDFERSDGLNSVIFRYFNVAGADPDGELGEQHRPETHLIPLMLDAIDGKRPALTVFGSDYPTPDGTCVRDYVHVCDLVDAHVLGLTWLQAGKGSRTFCLGSGQGSRGVTLWKSFASPTCRSSTWRTIWKRPRTSPTTLQSCWRTTTPPSFSRPWAPSPERGACRK
jgi:UDP-glucose 4-epimerase